MTPARFKKPGKTANFECAEENGHGGVSWRHSGVRLAPKVGIYSNPAFVMRTSEADRGPLARWLLVPTNRNPTKLRLKRRVHAGRFSGVQQNSHQIEKRTPQKAVDFHDVRRNNAGIARREATNGANGRAPGQRVVIATAQHTSLEAAHTREAEEHRFASVMTSR